jgi:hypothetical protein
MRYHHVSLVEGSDQLPVSVHAGGIVWSGDRLLVAATLGGIREFRMSGIHRVGQRRFAMSQVSHLKPSEKFRYSFLAEGTDGIIAGEYATSENGRLAGLVVSDGIVSVRDIHTPTVPMMQGAVRIDDTWAITASRGDRLNGDLWTGTRGSLTKHEGALPPGPEDLAWWADRRQLWGVTEHPGQRWVYVIDWPV